jgi:hypothetical protein
MKESNDSLLIGADSMNLESMQLKSNNSMKLFKHDKEKIVWGTAGNRGLGRDDFSPWLRKLDVNGDWQELKTKVADKIAELNGEQRIRTTKAGVVPTDDMVINCLLVGWINGEPQILEFTDKGIIDSYIVDGFRAIGSGWVVATSAYNTLVNIIGIDNENKFKIILNTTIRSIVTCGGQGVILRVKKDCIEDVENCR